MPVHAQIPAKSITVIRSKLNVSQVDFAAMLSMSASQVSAWESGASPVGGAIWLAMCLLAGESPNWLPTKKELAEAEAWMNKRRAANLSAGRVSRPKKKIVAKKRK